MRYAGYEVRDGSVRILRIGADGPGLLIIPENCVSIRAGEYGLDPVDDFEDVLDILLYENDLGLFPESTSILVSAPTLDDARNEVIRRCRERRDHKYENERVDSSPEMDNAHVEVLNALRLVFSQDRQLALLFRAQTKEAVKSIWEIDSRPKISMKAQMIDKIREREEV